MGKSKTNHKKIVFLDIDGTITNYEGEVPVSAEKAIKAAMDAGHELVLCTGRGYTQIYRKILDFGFTGVVSGAGAHVERKGEVLFQYVTPKHQLKRLLDFYEKHEILYYLQEIHETTAPRYVLERQLQLLEEMNVPEENQKLLFGSIHEESNAYEREDVEKSIFYKACVSLEAFRQELGDYFKIEESSYRITDTVDGEITCAGIDKAYGMEQYRKAIGAEREDIIAVGDGPNDREMLEYAHVGVAMGNAKDSLKAFADMVTDDLEADGLYHAFVRLGLIEDFLK